MLACVLLLSSLHLPSALQAHSRSPLGPGSCRRSKCPKSSMGRNGDGALVSRRLPPASDFRSGRLIRLRAIPAMASKQTKCADDSDRAMAARQFSTRSREAGRATGDDRTAHRASAPGLRRGRQRCGSAEPASASRQRCADSSPTRDPRGERTCAAAGARLVAACWSAERPRDAIEGDPFRRVTRRGSLPKL